MARVKECEKANMPNRFQAQFENGDPFSSVISILEKKNRNLEKRKAKAEQLRDSLISGKALNDDQRASAMSLKEIETSIDFVRELISSLDVARSGHEKSSVNDAASSNERTQNKDPIRRMLDLENDLKKLSENADRLKALQPTGEDVLKASEIDTLLAFFSHNKISDKSCSSTYIKKVSSAYQKVFDRDRHSIYNGSPATFDDIFVLSKKMASSFRLLKQF
ncbi:hypothetical protein RF11_06216 [Thelohanellus kitauei]|uniref:Uncharacterized protein n=1 Tax=Thelohanellus kitauei TaxID=669202 RepID=A0A0C2M9M1_THEKT|nr:hypothetical protein RF11_06216 [Thelohanellus kitauei]